MIFRKSNVIMTTIEMKSMKKLKGITYLYENGILKEKLFIEGAIVNGKIIYKEKDILVKIQKKEKKICLVRNHNDYKIELPFEKGKRQKGKYFLKKEKIGLDIDIISRSIIKENQYIKIEYTLFVGHEKRNDYMWILKYEVIE